ncbi:MAG TPA: DUF4126 domain-containing protein [Burkholderiaceae bacterium]|nr:DUF4126 domain-containing protein [Burkholderiaceae bacterium]
MDAFLPYIQQFIANIFGNSGDVAGAAAKVVGGLDMAGLAALAAALGWASGIRLYLVVFITGAAGMLGWLPLPAGLHVLQHPVMLSASGFMLFVEFFADKIPGVDSLWDMVHSVIRVPAGAALAAGVFGADSATMGAVAGLMGGALAATSFATKATTRAAVNTSPEPFSNIAVSLAEEGAVMGMMWLATNYPVTFGITLFVVLVLSIWLVIVLFKYLKAVLQRLKKWFGDDSSNVGRAT